MRSSRQLKEITSSLSSVFIGHSVVQAACACAWTRSDNRRKGGGACGLLIFSAIPAITGGWTRHLSRPEGFICILVREHRTRKYRDQE